MMINRNGLTPLIVAFALAGCELQTEPAGNQSAPAADQAVAPGAEPQPKLPDCPFRQTADWHASIENGRILVNGRVDLMMAGFKPTLTPRDSETPGAIAFDLSLQQEQGAVVNERPRYEGRVSRSYGKAEIYCGGALIETIDVVVIG